MNHPIQLPMVTFRGKRYFVDVRLRELREVDVLAPLSFREYEQIATPGEIATLKGSIQEYYRQFVVEH